MDTIPTARMIPHPLVPELSVSDIDVGLQFYTALLEFKIEYQRPKDHFAYQMPNGRLIHPATPR